jgi:hypothetical protein
MRDGYKARPSSFRWPVAPAHSHVAPAQAGAHADRPKHAAYGFPPVREVVSGNAGNDSHFEWMFLP